MFDSLSSKLQNAFKNLRGLGKISESNVSDALARSAHGAARSRCQFQGRPRFHRARQDQGARRRKSSQSVQPGQQIIKIIHDELVDLLGSTNAALNLTGNPACVMMVGLAWLGQNHFQRQARASCCSNRAARRCSWRRTFIVRRRWTNWKRSANKLRFPCSCKRGETDVLKIAREALEFAQGEQSQHAHFRHRRPFAD